MLFRSELIGKLSNVGSFSERIDITVTHRTIHDIESDLKKTLELFTGEIIDVTPKEEPKSIAEIDLDAEFGPVLSEISQENVENGETTPKNDES